MNIFLSIVVFIVGLSLIICLHELGHLLIAKLCNVYCFEYSIGFGPCIFNKKKFQQRKLKKDEKVVFDTSETSSKDVKTQEEKSEERVIEEAVKEKGETNFCIRAFPLGGFVSMAGEDGNLTSEGKRIPKDRCLNSVNHFKQISIMLAGITMNFILCITLFFFARLCPVTVSNTSSNAVVVEKDSPASKAGLETGDQIIYLYQRYDGLLDENDQEVNGLYFPYAPEEKDDKWQIETYMDFKDGKTSATSYDECIPNCISYCALNVFTASANDQLTLPSQFEGLKVGTNSSRTMYITALDKEEIETEKIGVTPIKDKDGLVEYQLKPLGITSTTYKMHNSFGQAFTGAFVDFGQNFVELFKALGSIFTPSGWKNVGGIISIYKVTSTVVSTGQFATILRLVGLLSLNIGCFNLLPLPGLDGWQTLIALIETVIRKKLPQKFKSIANSVGMIVMFVLAGLLIIKDLII